MLLEICVDSLESAQAAQRGGAHRIELCSDLLEGGITPSAGLIGAVRDALSIPVFVMVRPRAGDASYTDDDLTVMRGDIAVAKNIGVDGVVLGVLKQDGHVDVEGTRALVECARPMGVTFHRAFDFTPSLEEALEKVILTGADRILTSGGRRTAVEGRGSIASLVAAAGARIGVMACGTIRADNIAGIAESTRAQEFHASLRKQVPSPVAYQHRDLALGEQATDEFARYTVTAEDVRTLLDTLQTPGSSEHIPILLR